MSTGWKNIKYRQDMPPPGGYGTIPYKRNLVTRGPSGFVIFGLCGGIFLCAFRMHKYQLKLYNLQLQEDQMSEKVLVPLLEAEKDRTLLRISKQAIESEALHLVGSGEQPDHIPGNVNELHKAKRFSIPALHEWSIFPNSIYAWYQNSQFPKVGP